MSPDPFLHLLGLCKKAGRLAVGEEPVGAACRAGQARLTLLARDAAESTRRRGERFSENGHAVYLEVPFSKEELGAALGRTSCALLAVTDAGFAAALCEKLSAQDPDRYAAAAQPLRRKADRVLQRQRERRQHEKNLRQGKRKPWVPPPQPPDHAENRPRKETRHAPASAHPTPAANPNPGSRRPSGKSRHNP